MCAVLCELGNILQLMPACFPWLCLVGFKREPARTTRDTATRWRTSRHDSASTDRLANATREGERMNASKMPPSLSHLTSRAIISRQRKQADACVHGPELLYAWTTRNIYPVAGLAPRCPTTQADLSPFPEW